MLVAFLIMLREGIEAALIVGIIATYLAQTGQRNYLGAVVGGVLLAVSLCVALGFALRFASAEFPQKQQELFEAGVGVFAVAMLTSMVFWMKSAARSIKSEMHEKIDAITGSRNAALALVVMAFLAVGREGLETVFFLFAIFEQSSGYAVPLGAALGLAAATGVGLLIFLGGLRLNLRRFFRFTGVFIIVVAAGLLAGSLRHLHEGGLWNSLQTVVANWSEILPQDGALGTVLAGLFGYTDTPTLGEVAIYFAYLIPALFLFFLPARGTTQTVAARPA